MKERGIWFDVKKGRVEEKRVKRQGERTGSRERERRGKEARER